MSIETLKTEINDYLKEYPEKLEEYNRIMEEFKENPTAPISVYQKVVQLISDNTELLDKFKHATESLTTTEEPIEIVGNFVRLVNTTLHGQGEPLRAMTRIIALFIEELIPIEYLQYRTELILENVENQYKQPILEAIKGIRPDIHSSRDALFHRISKNSGLLKSLPEDFIVHPKSEPLMQLQFFVMVGDLINNEYYPSIIKCLELYSTMIITSENATEWIRSFNPFIGDFFESSAKGFAPINYHPAKVLSLAKSEMKSVQVKWAIGQDLYTLLSELIEPPADQQTPLQMLITRASAQTPESAADGANAALYVTEMKAMKLCGAIKAVLKALQVGDAPRINEDIVKGLFGSTAVQRNGRFYGALVERARKAGGEAMAEFLRLRDQKMNELEPSSVDYRFFFKAAMRRPEIVRRIVLNGIHTARPSEDALRKAKTIISIFAINLPSVTFDVKNATEVILGGRRIMGQASALAVYYLTVLALMCEDVDEQEFLSLPTEMLTASRVPFEGSLAHADIVVVRLARALSAGELFELPSGSQLSIHGPFIYCVESNGDGINFEAIVNPTIPFVDQ